MRTVTTNSFQTDFEPRERHQVRGERETGTRGDPQPPPLLLTRHKQPPHRRIARFLEGVYHGGADRLLRRA